MGKIKQIEIKNRIYYFYNDIINIEEFDSNLLKVDKKSDKDIDIYQTLIFTILDTLQYITKLPILKMFIVKILCI